MLPFALILSAVIYGICYWLWSVAQSRPQNIVEVLRVFNEMIFVPGATIFFLLRSLIALIAVYILADFLISLFRRKRKTPEDEDITTLQYKFPPQRK